MVVELAIQLVPTGEIIHTEVVYRDATNAFVASVEKAVKKVGRFDKLRGLEPVLFDAHFRKFTLLFRPEDLRL
jgi:colicin import membrane protein